MKSRHFSFTRSNEICIPASACSAVAVESKSGIGAFGAAKAWMKRNQDGAAACDVGVPFEPSGMPASKEILSDEEIWSTVLFIRHLPPAGSLGDPPMYSK